MNAGAVIELKSKPKSSREMIIGVLTNEWPLSSKEIYNRITKQFLASISYQAVHKTLSELESEGALAKNDGKYSVNVEWIIDRKKQLEDMENSLTLKHKNKTEVNILESNTYHGFGRTLLKIFAEEYEKGTFKEIYTFQKHLWWLLALQKDEYYWLKTLGKSKGYIISNSKTLFDKSMAAAYNMAGIKVKLGVNYNSNFDFVVYGDMVYQVYFPDKLKRDINASTNQLKNTLDIFKKDHQNIMYSKTDIIKTVIIKDEKLAEQFKNDVKNSFWEE